MNITKHAKERYAERIMEKSSNNDIQRFIVEQSEKIQKDIEKMVQYGKIIYSGKQTQKDKSSNNVINVYVNGCWIVLLDTKTDNVITLYKVDLGAGEDFNAVYVEKMLKKVDEAFYRKDNIEQEVCQQAKELQNLINDGISQINTYKNYIKKIEELISGYKTIMENNAVKVSIANDEAVAIVNKLIGKREF